MNDLSSTLLKLLVALALGLLVGLQRQRAASRVAGVRTFPLITLAGAVAALLAPALGPGLLAAGALALAALLVMANVIKLRLAEPDPGTTTEFAALLMYGVGAYLIVGHMAVAVALGATVALLLHLKERLHRFVAAMGERDVTAVMQFALISLVILPVLPDTAYGPYAVLNPQRIWWMVVLIVAIGLSGYVAVKLFGDRAGALLGGILGGLVSSTATTVSYARRTRHGEVEAGGEAAAAALAARVIVVASTVSFLRIMVEVAVVAPGQLPVVAPPLAAMAAWLLLLSLLCWLSRDGAARAVLPHTGNPAELGSALIFGALYALVLFAVAFAKDRFGAAGLYPVAVLSGLTDLDAITLSTATLAREGRLDAQSTWRLILVAALANLVFKGGVAGVLGSPGLRLRVGFWFGLALAGGAAILLLWP